MENGRNRILIRKGRILNPQSGLDMTGDILIENGKILKVSNYIDEPADDIIEAYGCYVMPGLIDLHVHLREPGYEYKETVKTGAQAALRGGFTTICAMPNTSPATDTPETVRYVIDRAKDEVTDVLPVGAVTVGQHGCNITDIHAMRQAGICAVSEDGKSVMNSGLYREAMLAALKENIPVMSHCEDINLVNGGSTGADISNAVENVIIARDVILAKETGVKLHLCHCSTAESVEMVRRAKEAGISVTAEVCPHHFSMCIDDIDMNDANYKMNPPVRSRKDLEALREGLRSDIMDVIATDHAPHASYEKEQGMKNAPFGITGLETAVCLTITELVEKGYITPLQMAEKMSYNPAMILGIDRGVIAEGKIADITIINPNEEYVINSAEFVSMGKNTPFNGKKVRGRVKWVIKEGKPYKIN